jgi:alkanesulfonate monooxygenase SsuD/methylene tetrahydromethanopterin reductase-like flavin-dependent oxidoreductase (luciferase family)
MRAILRFNLILPGLDPQLNAQRHRAFVELAAYADKHGFDSVSLEEHHGAENGWSPSPMILAALVVGATKRLGVSLSALLVPLHDPLRVAEDLAVLDLASGGRVVTIAGLGYRPSEYTAHGKDWTNRGAVMDDALDTVLKAWTGQPFEYRGTTVQVTPTPVSKPHPIFMVGGSSKVAVRRASRFGLPFCASAHVPELEPYYYEQCAEQGTSGFFIAPPPDTAMLHIAEDPDRVWAEYGQCFLHESSTYAGWQTGGIKSAVKSSATTVEELRAEGIYQVLTPQQCVDRVKAQGAHGVVVLHPLCGGMPIDEAWKSVELCATEVLPNV